MWVVKERRVRVWVAEERVAREWGVARVWVADEEEKMVRLWV